MTNIKKPTSGTQTEVKQESRITERTLLVDEARAIERVKPWGHIVSPVMVYDQWHKLVPSEVHYWEQNGQYKKILKRANAFNPHEEYQAKLRALIQRLNEIKQEERRAKEDKARAQGEQTAELVDKVSKGYGLTIKDTHFSANDYTMHIEVLSEKYFGVVKDSFEQGDDVQAGLDLYNGIENSTGIGGSMYTMRLNCINGAVARGKELGTFSIANVIDADKRLAQMELGVIDIFEKFDIVIQRYRTAAQIKANLKLANQWVLKLRNRIADEHMPESFILDEDYDERLKRFQKKNENMDLAEIFNMGLKDPRNAPIPVIKVKDNPDMWQVFNQTTGSINEKHKEKYESGKFEGRPKLNFASLGNNTNAAHRQLFAVVARGASANEQ